MSNKTQLSNNNAQLASLIQELQGKAAGGSGSVETCTVVFGNVVGYTEPDDVVAYTDGNGQMQVEAIDGGMSITALKNSLIVVPYSYYDATGITLVRTMFGCAICKVTG